MYKINIYIIIIISMLYTTSLYALEYPQDLLSYDKLSVANYSNSMIILIHGWNPDDDLNSFYSIEWSSLHDALQNKLSDNDDWGIGYYHWEQDASTGPFYWFVSKNDSVNNANKVAFGVDNAIKAAENAWSHGDNLADILISKIPQINYSKIHLIAHSAGTWVAYRAAELIGENRPDMQIQITLLDPFIPDLARSTPDHPQNLQLLSSLSNNYTVKILEQYYTASNLDPCLGTNTNIVWNSKGVNLDLSDTVPNLSFLSLHSYPIKWYANTVDNPTGYNLGWAHGIKYTEPIIVLENPPSSPWSTIESNFEFKFNITSTNGIHYASFIFDGGTISMNNYTNQLWQGECYLNLGINNIAVYATSSNEIQSRKEIVITRIEVNNEILPVGIVSPNPPTLDFGPVEVGQSKTLSFTITNIGGGILTGSADESDPEYSIESGGGPFSLSLNEMRTVTVKLSPESIGDKNGDIHLSGPYTLPNVNLKGQGVPYEGPKGIVSPNPPTLNFGPVEVGQSKTLSFTITNIGGGILTGSADESSPEYSIESGGGPFSLSSGEILTVEVKLSPISIGDKNGIIHLSGPYPLPNVNLVGVGGPPTGVKNEIEPISILLMQNYPNPFNPFTTIDYQISTEFSDRVTLMVYNLYGAVVKTLVDRYESPGRHAVIWDGRDESGNKVSSGIYIYQLNAGKFIQSNKMIYVR